MSEGPDAHPVFVLGTHFNGLAVIQALGKSAVPVYAIDTHRSVGTFSRYANFWISPDPSTSETEFTDFLVRKGKQSKSKPLLFPTGDKWVAAVSKNRRTLFEWFLMAIPDWDIVRLTIEKDRFFRWTQEKGFPVPKTYFGIDEINESVFPILAKPKFRSMSADNEYNSYIEKVSNELRLVRLNTVQDFDDFCHTHSEVLAHFIFQEEVVGMANRMYTVGIYADEDSELLAIFTGRKLRGFPPDIGDCVFGQSEPLPELAELTRRLVKDLGYTGVAEVEFKKDARTEVYKLIEVNPRSWSWIGITPACGVNIPLIVYNHLVFEKKDFFQSQCGVGEVKWVRIINDLLSCMYKNRKIGFPKQSMKFITWLNSLKGKKVIAEFDRSEPLIVVIFMLRKLYESLKGKRK